MLSTIRPVFPLRALRNAAAAFVVSFSLMMLLGFLTEFRSPMHLFINTPVGVFAITFMFYRGTALNFSERRFTAYGGIPALDGAPAGPWDFSTISKSTDPYLEVYPHVEWHIRGSFSTSEGALCLDSDSGLSPKALLKALEPHHAQASAWETGVSSRGLTLRFGEAGVQAFARLDETPRGSRVFIVVCPQVSQPHTETAARTLFAALSEIVTASCVPA
jgi:hypothetical protein